MGIELDRLREINNGLIETADLGVSDAARIIGFRVVGMALDDAVQRIDIGLHRLGIGARGFRVAGTASAAIRAGHRFAAGERRRQSQRSSENQNFAMARHSKFPIWSISIRLSPCHAENA